MATNEQVESTAKNNNNPGSVQLPLKIKFRIPQRIKNENNPADNGAGAQSVTHDPLDPEKLPDITGPLNGKKRSNVIPIMMDSESDTEIEVFEGDSTIQPTKRGPQANQGSESDDLKFIHYGDRKRKRLPDSVSEGDLSDGPAPTKPQSKKAHTQPRKDDTKDPRVFTVYLEVWSNVTTTEPKRMGRAAKTTTTMASITKGPFKFDTARSFSDFRREIANTLPCREALLPVAHFEWKFEREARSAPRKKISDLQGYKALIDAIMKKRLTENVVVWLHLPKPAKDEQDWDTRCADYVSRPFDFDEEQQPKTTKEIIDEMAEKRSAAVTALEGEYPVGKIPMFEGKRVWQNKATGSYFELTPMRMKVWANAIASNMADLSAPPTSNHFTEDKKIKVAPAAIRPPSAQPADIPPFPGYPPPPAGGYHPYYPPPYVPYMPLPGYPYPYAPPHATVPPGAALPRRSSGKSTTSHNVTLAEFCETYGISKKDQGKLEKLEYQPGNQDVKQLDEQDWRDFASFTKLGWVAFLNAHRDFCTVIRARNM